MNLTCATKGHDWVEDYPGFPTIFAPHKVFVCQRCGETRIEGTQDKPRKNRLGDVVHNLHKEMCKPEPDRKKIKGLRKLHEKRKLV